MTTMTSKPTKTIDGVLTELAPDTCKDKDDLQRVLTAFEARASSLLADVKLMLNKFPHQGTAQTRADVLWALSFDLMLAASNLDSSCNVALAACGKKHRFRKLRKTALEENQSCVMHQERAQQLLATLPVDWEERCKALKQVAFHVQKARVAADVAFNFSNTLNAVYPP